MVGGTQKSRCQKHILINTLLCCCPGSLEVVDAKDLERQEDLMFFERVSIHILACGFRKANNSPANRSLSEQHVHSPRI